ncbi:MAG: Glucokinase [Chlamydiae bacterium]|nr:Glucokinase [Chlamydiota bacterium]
MIVAGDIGGTKAKLALFEENLEPKQIATVPSRKYPNLHTIIREYLEQCGNPEVSAAVFALPGPVENGICATTNLPWVIDSKVLATECGIPAIHLLNDLEANAYGIETLPKESLEELSPGRGKCVGNRAVVSPGTGLGEAGIFWDGKSYHPFACEGGHSDFSPQDELQVKLFTYLKERFGHVSYERVLSGPGLYNLYQFFIEVMGREQSSEIAEKMKEEDPGKVITHHALNGESELCSETLDLFISILGAEVGNCGLKFMAWGGIYLGGGIPPKILPKLRESRFLEAVTSKGRMSSVVRKMPVHVILDDKTALRGAAHFVIS